MTYKEIQELVKLVQKNNLSEFKVKDGDFELVIRTDKYGKEKTTQIVSAAPMITAAKEEVPPADAASPPAASGGSPAPAAEQSSNLLEIKSPIVGTMYRSASPDKDPYVKVGDTVEVGSVVCIVEAMKLFNEIESEVAGKIVKVVVDDSSPVEYDQVLFLVDPNG